MSIFILNFWIMMPFFRNITIFKSQYHSNRPSILILFIWFMSFNIRYYSKVCFIKYRHFLFILPFIWHRHTILLHFIFYCFTISIFNVVIMHPLFWNKTFFIYQPHSNCIFFIIILKLWFYIITLSITIIFFKILLFYLLI